MRLGRKLLDDGNRFVFGAHGMKKEVSVGEPKT